MKKTLSSIAFAAGFAATSAMAADLPSYSEPAFVPAPIFTWDGFYVGANIGYGWGDAELTFPGVVTFDSGDYDGFIGGLQAGYNAQFEQFVIGLETDIQLSGVEASGALVPGVFGESELKWFGTTRARVGYAFDRFLPYITGGVAYGENKISLTGIGGGVSSSKTHVGWTVGAGLEAAFTDNLSAKVEYLYIDFDDKNYFSGVIPGGVRGDSDLHIARIGLNYRF